MNKRNTRLNFRFKKGYEDYDESGKKIWIEYPDWPKKQARLDHVRKIQTAVYLERLSTTLFVSVPLIELMTWLGDRYLTQQKIFEGYCMQRGWSTNALNSALSLLESYGYINNNPTGYQVLRTGERIPLYHITDTFKEAFLTVEFPSIDINKAQDPEVLNRHIQEWVGEYVK